MPRDENHSARQLLGLQVTTRSPIGATCYVCGGILIDHGVGCGSWALAASG
ncbi:DUF2625 family protein [Campylobacter rectus]|uniref:DUF2625 family protein n=1 Tax=Campylobacter rectus TaxID=203 RepID=UPI0028E403C0|nr:DUF2625 family protein [Campylobacter rectus]